MAGLKNSLIYKKYNNINKIKTYDYAQSPNSSL